MCAEFYSDTTNHTHSINLCLLLSIIILAAEEGTAEESVVTPFINYKFRSTDCMPGESGPSSPPSMGNRGSPSSAPIQEVNGINVITQEHLPKYSFLLSSRKTKTRGITKGTGAALTTCPCSALRRCPTSLWGDPTWPMRTR